MTVFNPCLARFLRIGHTPGALVPLTVPVSAEHPLTLDLRLGGT